VTVVIAEATLGVLLPVMHRDVSDNFARNIDGAIIGVDNEKTFECTRNADGD
jgi:hypothetical protein